MKAAPPPAAAARFASAWADLATLGRDSRRGGYSRHVFDDGDLQLREWFTAQATRRGLDVEVDRNSNIWAWWGTPAPGAVVTGSHLDSVPGGGAFDGPLGVVSALLAIDELRVRQFNPAKPMAVVCFAEEEGGRFGLPCLGSRLLTGAADADHVRRLHDADGVSFADAARRAGFDAGRIGRDPERLALIGAFLELHVEQGRRLHEADPNAAIGVGSQIVAHGRWRITVTGEGNHAGTTRPSDRHDPMLPAAAAVLAARRALSTHDGAVATIGRLQPVPGGTNVIASSVQAWLDVRHGTAADTAALVDEIVAAVREEAELEGCSVLVHRESLSDQVMFDPALTMELAAALKAPVIPTGAGHDAGILAAAVPSTMLFVRNPTGVSHAPGEFAETADCLVGIEALADSLAELARVTTYRALAAYIGGELSGPVDIACHGGLITGITDADGADGFDEVLPGLVLPGFADAHSHVFHRGLRGRTHGSAGGVGSFWTWRETMYSLAERLNPDTFRELAIAAYTELVCAGYTAVGEFHYLHHGPGGVPYAEPNEMGIAVAAAADEVGIGLTLLDVAYLAGGFGIPVNTVQERFSDGDAERWAARVSDLASVLPTGRFAPVRVGAAIHSVRAVPVAQLPEVARSAQQQGLPLHVHLSEQRAENDAALAATGRTPTQLLDDAGALSDRTAVVHATHLTAHDVELLGAARSSVVICPTTEADLADGLPRAAELRAAGAVLTLGGDQHVITDPFAQARGLEYGERLASGARGTFSPEVLIDCATDASHRAIGSSAGRIEVGAPADFVAVDTASARTAGSLGLQLVMSASAADVAAVVVGGVVQARYGRHVRLGDPGPLLQRAIEGAWGG